MNDPSLLALIESIIQSIESLVAELEVPEHKRVHLGHEGGGLADANELRRRVLRLLEVVREAGEQGGRTESWWVYKNGVDAVLEGEGT